MVSYIIIINIILFCPGVGATSKPLTTIIKTNKTHTTLEAEPSLLKVLVAYTTALADVALLDELG